MKENRAEKDDGRVKIESIRETRDARRRRETRKLTDFLPHCDYALSVLGFYYEINTIGKTNDRYLRLINKIMFVRSTCPSIC